MAGETSQVLLRFLNPLRLSSLFKLRAARERYRKRPGQEETLALSRLLVKVGDRAGAMKHLRSGLQRFPQAQDLQDLHRTLWARTAEAQIRALERVCLEDPTPEELARLVELHRSVRNFDRSLQVCVEAEKKHPDSWVLKLAAGKALYHRFLLERNQEDGLKSAEYLRQALAMKRDSRRALLYLTVLLAELGMKDEATSMADELARVAPNDPQAQRVRDSLRKGGGRLTSPGGGPAASRRGAASRGAEPDLLTTLMDDLRSTPEICGALIFESGGAVSHRHEAPNKHFELEGHEESIAALAKAAQLAAERMGIGRLQICVIEGNPWWIYFGDIAGSSLVVFAERGFKPSSFEAVANRFSLDMVTL